MSPSAQAVVGEDIARVLACRTNWEKLAGCRVVVTGAGGFLGGYLVRTLLALSLQGKVSAPLRVVALVRDRARARERLADIVDSEHLELLEWDLGQIALPDLGAANVVIHAASQASPRFFGADPVGTMLPNTVGTASLLQALARCPDPRGFLFVSSSEVYGSANSAGPIAESEPGAVDPAAVRSCYAESKRAGEALCVAWHRQHGLPTYIVRPFHTYGPGLALDDGRVFADFAHNVARSENLVMTGAGDARRAFCYVSDAVSGFFKVLLEGTPGIAYNVANARGEMSVLELAELLISIYPERGLRIERSNPQGDYLPSAVSRIVPDTTRLESLSWTPRIMPRDGFERMVRALTA